MFVCVRRVAGHFVPGAGGVFSLGLLAVFGAILTGVGLGHQIASGASGERAISEVVSQTVVLQDGSNWLSEGYWRRKALKRRRQQIYSNRSSLGVNPFDSKAAVKPKTRKRRKVSADGNYRTVCVRLCDGFYFPISFSTNKRRFAADERACQSKCSGDARLFYFSNAGGSTDTMKDLKGRPYAKLENAFLYRTSYDKSCQCRPDPWSDGEKQRHAEYQTKGWKKRARLAARREHRRGLAAVRKARHKTRIVNFKATPAAPTTDGAGGDVVASATLPPAFFGRREDVRIRPRSRRFSSGRSSLGRRPSVRRASRPRPRRASRRRRGWKRNAFGSDS